MMTSAPTPTRAVTTTVKATDEAALTRRVPGMTAAYRGPAGAPVARRTVVA
jgi:hypothetical protein